MICENIIQWNLRKHTIPAGEYKSILIFSRAVLENEATYLLSIVSVCLFVCLYVCMYVCGQLRIIWYNIFSFY